MVRLTHAGVGLATASLTLLAMGLFLANVEMLALAAIPGLLLATALGGRPAGVTEGKRALSTRTPMRGDTVDVDLQVRADAELFEVHAPLPPGVALEDGTNLLLHAQSGWHAARFRIRAHVRGAQTMGAVTSQAIDPLGLLAPRTSEIAPAETLEVTPRARRERRVRGRLRVHEREEARLGVASTDFRELRDYSWGDPPKAINWKATAKRLTRRDGHGGATPLVNEFEKEGKQTVVVLLDGGAPLRVGTSVETGLDHGVEAAVGIARLFLGRGARVGAATFHARASPPAAPEAGASQGPTVERALSPGEPAKEPSASRVLQQLQPHLAGSRPSVVIVTRVTPENAPELVALAARMRVLLHARGRPPLYVVDVKALAMTPAPSAAWEGARALVAREDADAALAVEEAGARVVAWRPEREELRAALARRGLA